MSSTLPPASLSELQAEMVALRNKIQGEENSIAQLRNAHPTLPDAMLQLEEQIARTQSSVIASKQRFYRLVHAHAAHAGTLSVYFAFQLRGCVPLTSRQTGHCSRPKHPPISLCLRQPLRSKTRLNTTKIRNATRGQGSVRCTTRLPRTLNSARSPWRYVHRMYFHTHRTSRSTQELRLRDLQAQSSSRPSHTHASTNSNACVVPPFPLSDASSLTASASSPWAVAPPLSATDVSVYPWRVTGGASGFAALASPKDAVATKTQRMDFLDSLAAVWAQRGQPLPPAFIGVAHGACAPTWRNLEVAQGGELGVLRLCGHDLDMCEFYSLVINAGGFQKVYTCSRAYTRPALTNSRRSRTAQGGAPSSPSSASSTPRTSRVQTAGGWRAFTRISYSRSRSTRTSAIPRSPPVSRPIAPPSRAPPHRPELWTRHPSRDPRTLIPLWRLLSLCRAHLALQR
jgi:hypothetical protein